MMMPTKTRTVLQDPSESSRQSEPDFDWSPSGSSSGRAETSAIIYVSEGMNFYFICSRSITLSQAVFREIPIELPATQM